MQSVLKWRRWDEPKNVSYCQHDTQSITQNRFMVDFSSSLNLRKLKMTIISDDDARSC